MWRNRRDWCGTKTALMQMCDGITSAEQERVFHDAEWTGSAAAYGRRGGDHTPEAIQREGPCRDGKEDGVVCSMRGLAQVIFYTVFMFLIISVPFPMPKMDGPPWPPRQGSDVHRAAAPCSACLRNG